MRGLVLRDSLYYILKLLMKVKEVVAEQIRNDRCNVGKAKGIEESKEPNQEGVKYLFFCTNRSNVTQGNMGNRVNDEVEAV